MNKFWLISADMGYGHHRAIYPLKILANEEKIFNANQMQNASAKERRLWAGMLAGYVFVSRAVKLPLLGKFFSHFLDSLLYIPKFYPLSDRSTTTYQVKYLKRRIKNGLTSSVIDHISNPELPVLTSFYSIAIAADLSGHKKVYCIICDTDINRVWVAENPSSGNIVYFASGTISEQRLYSYGVPEKNIQLTGFPLPLELLGDRNLDILKRNLVRRLRNLDPENRFYNLYKHSVNAYLDYDQSYLNEPHNNKSAITITFAVGGAGAQKEIGEQIADGLSRMIIEGKVKLNLVAGTRPDIRDYFLKVRNKYNPDCKNINIIWSEDFAAYYTLFNIALHTTDILWTKPSELSLYCALGLPVIATPPIGPQEKCNRRWLRETGAGIKQPNPRFSAQWLTDMLKRGHLAEAAWLGFLKARKYGTYNIIDFLEKGYFTISNDPMKR
jgi:hypothetical protein